MATVTYSPATLECKYLLPCGLCELKKEKCTQLGSTITTNPAWSIPMPTIHTTDIDITCSAERKE